MTNVTFAHNLDDSGLQKSGEGTYTSANFDSAAHTIDLRAGGQCRELHPEPGGGLLMNRRLYRSRRDSMLGGVAGGVADYFDMDPSIVRVAWAVLALVTGGIFLVLYIVMWIVVPEGPSAATVARTAAEDAPGAAAGAGQRAGHESTHRRRGTGR